MLDVKPDRPFGKRTAGYGLQKTACLQQAGLTRRPAGIRSRNQEMVCPGLVQAAQGVPGTRCSLYSLDRTGLFALEKEAMDVMSQDSHFLLYFCMVHFKLNVPDS